MESIQGNIEKYPPQKKKKKNLRWGKPTSKKSYHKRLLLKDLCA